MFPLHTFLHSSLRDCLFLCRSCQSSFCWNDIYHHYTAELSLLCHQHWGASLEGSLHTLLSHCFYQSLCVLLLTQPMFHAVRRMVNISPKPFYFLYDQRNSINKPVITAGLSRVIQSAASQISMPLCITVNVLRTDLQASAALNTEHHFVCQIWCSKGNVWRAVVLCLGLTALHCAFMCRLCRWPASLVSTWQNRTVGATWPNACNCHWFDSRQRPLLEVIHLSLPVSCLPLHLSITNGYPFHSDFQEAKIRFVCSYMLNN